MKNLFIFLFAFGFSSAEAALVQQISCERAKAVKEAAFELLQERGVEEAELAAHKQGLSETPEELADLLLDCHIEPSRTVGLLDEWEGGLGEQEKSCKAAIDDYSKNESSALMTAALPAVLGIVIGVAGLTACESEYERSERLRVERLERRLKRHRQRTQKKTYRERPAGK